MVSDSLCRATKRKPRVPSFQSEQLAQMQEEVSSLLEKGTIAVVDSHPSHTEFYSILFLVPKTNGQMRPVINLKALNQWVVSSFQNGRNHSLRSAEAGRLTGESRLEGAYLTVPVHPDHQCYLRFSIEEVDYSTSSPVSHLCPMGLHKDNEGGGDLTQVMGNQNNNLH